MSPVSRIRTQNAVFLALALGFLAFAMFPGRFSGDEISQYRQGLNTHFTDATSVWTSALLGMLADVAPGPGPMFLVQLLVWMVGVWGLSDALILSGRTAAGQAISVLCAAPLLTFGFFDVQKDAWLTALLALLAAAGARRILLGARTTLLSGAGLALAFLFALDSRHNALFALMPLALLFWPPASLRLRPLLTTLVIASAVVLAGRTVLNRVNHGPLKADQAHFAYSLMVYDLAGITVRAGEDASRGLFPAFVDQARRCYSIHEWDGFQGGACQSTGLAAQQLMTSAEGRRALAKAWAAGAARHPVAYLTHRARHFGCHLGLGCARVHQVLSAGWLPRPWDEPQMRLTGSARILGTLAAWLWSGPLGSGLLWLGLLSLEALTGALTLRREGRDPTALLTLAVGASGLVYLAAFAVVSIADQMRYLLPVIFLGLVGIPLAIGTLARSWKGRAA